MMFPLSKLAVDLSAGAKEDQGVLDFAAGQVVRRSKSAKAALPCMLAACVYSGFVIISECTSDGGLVVSAGPPQLRSLAKALTAGVAFCISGGRVRAELAGGVRVGAGAGCIRAATAARGGGANDDRQQPISGRDRVRLDLSFGSGSV